jgi:aspartyl-tRNA synthetase
MSFADARQIQTLVENLLNEIWSSQGFRIDLPFPIISYEDSLALYGTDKPDLTFEEKVYCIVDVTALFSPHIDFFKKINNFNSENSDFKVLALSFPDCADFIKNKDFSDWQALAASSSLKLFFFRECDREFKGLLIKFFSCKVRNDFNAFFSSNHRKSFVLLMAGAPTEIRNFLGKLRVRVADLLAMKNKNVREKKFSFLWVEKFPLFTLSEEKKIASTHHPFTAPLPEDYYKLFENPLEVCGLHYDLVINGQEIGGGSVRIHDASVQRRIFTKILKRKEEDFEHLLKALESGCPPHAGVALGFDRLLSVLLKTESIRDVIAFPKNSKGVDLLTKAPVCLDDELLKLYKLQLIT